VESAIGAEAKKTPIENGALVAGGFIGGSFLREVQRGIYRKEASGGFFGDVFFPRDGRRCRGSG